MGKLAGKVASLPYHTDEFGAEDTRKRVEACGRKAVVQRLDVRDEASVASVFAAADRHLTMRGWEATELASPRLSPRLLIELSGPICTVRSSAAENSSDADKERAAAAR